MVNVKSSSSLDVSWESFFYETMLYESSTINWIQEETNNWIIISISVIIIIVIIIISIYYCLNMCQAWTEIYLHISSVLNSL